MKISISATSCCYYNAVIENFFHTLKTEHVSLLRFKTRSKAISSIFEYVEFFYNQKRIHYTLNYLSPTQFEELNYHGVKKYLEKI
ncbi:IS3 family transposase [Candidatus Dependentiae bacterium]